FLRLPLRARGQGRDLLHRLRAQARGSRRGRGVREILPRCRRGRVRRDVRARGRDQREGGLGPLEQHRGRRALPDGAREAARALPPRAGERRRHARGAAQGGAPLRGAHAHRPAAAHLRRLRRHGDRSLSALGGLRALALALFAAIAPPSAEALRGAVFDRMQRAFPLERTSAPALIVAIDEDSLRRYGQWPWPRTRLAELLDRIDAMHPAAIALDMFFPEPDRYSPGALARAMSLPPPVAHLL